MEGREDFILTGNEVVNDRVDVMDYLEGTNEVRTELFVGEAEPDMLSGVKEWRRLALSVGKAFLGIRGFLQMPVSHYRSLCRNQSSTAGTVPGSASQGNMGGWKPSTH